MSKRLPILFVVLAVIAAFAGAEANAAPAPKGNYIVVLNDGVADPGAVAAQHARAFGGQVSHVYRYALKGYSVTLPNAALPALQANPRVRFVSEDREVRATGQVAPTCVPGDQSRCLGAGVDRIDGERSSTRSGDGRGSVNINVAVLDTGIDTDHPDLSVTGGIDCTQGAGSFEDDAGHGTAVAGFIGELDNSIGRVGVAPGVRLWAVKVLKKNGAGTDSTITCGIDWVTSTRSDADPSNDVAVTNMSLGAKGVDDGNCGLTNGDAVHLAICNSVASGVSYVVAAGNETRDLASHIPAAYDEVLTATAMTDFDGQPGGLEPGFDFPSGSCAGLVASLGFSDDSTALFSNFATVPEDQVHSVAAPGVCIGSTCMGGGYGCGGSGTSFASPLVAGTVALCIASGPCAGLTPAQIIQKIVADAAAYNNAHPEYGFEGDPLRPVEGKYYGYLIRAALY